LRGTERRSGLGGSGVAGQGQGPVRTTGAAPAGAGRGWGGADRGPAVQSRAGRGATEAGWCGPGPGVAGAGHGWGGASGAHGSDARERERSGRKKGWARVLYLLIFVGATNEPTNLSRLAYVAAVAPCVRQPPDEHKLRMSVFKI
jgi:hypothetical protein